MMKRKTANNKNNIFKVLLAKYMNWGYKVLLGILAFVSGIIAMVVIAYKQTNEMEDEKYYVKELTYQQVIDAKKTLQAADTLAVTDSAGTIFVKLPQKF